MQEELAAEGRRGEEAVRGRRRPTACSTRCRAKYYDAFRAAKQTEGKQARAEACAALKKQAVAEMIPDPKAEGAITAEAFASAWEALETRVVRDLILAGTRPDGRDYTTLRPIELRGRRAAAGARLGRVPARRDAGAGHGHAGHRPRRAARRRPGRGVLAEVHAPLLLPAVLGGRVPADPRPGPPRDRPRGAGRAERQAGAARPRRVPLHDPHHLRHPRDRTARVRWPASAGPRWA